MGLSRQSLYRQLSPEGWDKVGLSPTNKLVCLLIVLASLIAIVETEATIRDSNAAVFDHLETFFVAIFSLEYFARVYAAGEYPKYGGLVGRFKYAISFWSLVDLIAILPYFIGFIAANNVFLLRLFRVIRLLRLSRLGRFSRALTALGDALKARVYELMLSIGLALLLLVFSSACLYAVEASNQPEAFGSIPRALWWSVATLTTVGYGDVTPITALGKFFAGITAVSGVAIIAIPTGILAAAFSNAFQKTTDEQG